MNRQHVLYLLFILLVLIASLHFIGQERYWYWIFWWFDLVTHFLFGLWVGIFALWILFLSRYVGVRTFHPFRAFIFTLIAVLSVGIGWEVFEVWAGIPIKDGHTLDTVFDILMDISGASIGCVFFNSSWILKK